MRFNARFAVFFCFLLFVLTLTVPWTAAVTEFQVDSVDLQIYRDGLVRITQTLTVNETLPEVSFPLLGSSVDNFVVLDENQTVLDYEVQAGNLTIFTLGTTSVAIQYDTSSLTSKDAEVWTFRVDTPYNITVLLPEEATILGLSGTPASIDTDGNRIVFSLFPDQWEIDYVFPLTSPADFQINDLEVTSNEVRVGEEVVVSVRVTNVGGQSGTFSLPLIVNQTVEETRTVTLEDGESRTIEFRLTKQTTGTYIINIDELVGQFTVIEESSNGSPSDMIPLEYLIAVLAIGATIFVIMLFFFRRKGASVENIFKMYPQLNIEEKNVIRFLAENDGKAFESQIRKKFPNIPRTSLWRLVKRLEKLEIISVKKIGLENQVELKK